VLARIPTEGAKTRDITGGLPRVAELFEARRPKDHAIIAEIDGRVEFGKRLQEQAPHHRSCPTTTAEPVEYLIPKGKHIIVQEGDFVEKGDYIVDGNPAPHDILPSRASRRWPNYLVNEIQEVYRLQGVPINDKHIEVIVRQMLQKVEITDRATPTCSGRAVDKRPSSTRSTPRR
jgi:DNA-directed RNA polymerase subunit beta'